MFRKRVLARVIGLSHAGALCQSVIDTAAERYDRRPDGKPVGDRAEKQTFVPADADQDAQARHQQHRVSRGGGGAGVARSRTARGQSWTD